MQDTVKQIGKETHLQHVGTDNSFCLNCEPRMLGDRFKSTEYKQGSVKNKQISVSFMPVFLLITLPSLPFCVFVIN